MIANRSRQFIILAFAIGLIAGNALAYSGDAARRPNVVVVLTDDQGYADLGCHGNPELKTPNLDRLYAQSIRFTDFHVAPMCTPTRGQLMTGCDALRNGAMNVSGGRTLLRTEFPTMADVFAANGYRTGHFGKWHLGDNHPYRPFERGFQESIYMKSWGIYSAADYWNNDYFDDFFWERGVAKQYPGYCTDLFFNEAMRFMKASRDQQQPFFVYLPLNAAHGPLFVPDKYREPYRHLPKPLASFFGMIANIDENMGRLDTMLRDTGLYDNTIVVFMTDNGGTAGVKFYNAGMRGMKTQLYDGGHRVPCFVRWPAGKLRPAGDVRELTQCQDLLPTFIDLCGLTPPAGAKFDGTSLAKLMRGEQEALADRTLVVQYSRFNNMAPPKKHDACVMWKRWRLVNGTELYNLDSDPAQEQNVASAQTEIRDRLLAHYEHWWAGVEPRINDQSAITVGSDAENPVTLAPADWENIHFDDSLHVRRGDNQNAPWNIHVSQAGTYEISLRRWPKESKLAITADTPAYQGVDGELAAGVALPIAQARLRVAGIDRTIDVKPGDLAATFTVTLAAGRTQIEASFSDRDGKQLCGAYYTYVERK